MVYLNPCSVTPFQEQLFHSKTSLECDSTDFIRIVSLVLEIPVASKLGTPRYFTPKPHVITVADLEMFRGGGSGSGSFQ